MTRMTVNAITLGEMAISSVSDQPMSDPQRISIKFRRDSGLAACSGCHFIAFPKAATRLRSGSNQHIGSGRVWVQSLAVEQEPMSQMGHERTKSGVRISSAFHPI